MLPRLRRLCWPLVRLRLIVTEAEKEAHRRYPAPRENYGSGSASLIMKGMRAAQQRAAFVAGWEAALAVRHGPFCNDGLPLTDYGVYTCEGECLDNEPTG